jgi:hypothetical protein
VVGRLAVRGAWIDRHADVGARAVAPAGARLPHLDAVAQAAARDERVEGAEDRAGVEASGAVTGLDRQHDRAGLAQADRHDETARRRHA